MFHVEHPPAPPVQSPHPGTARLRLLLPIRGLLALAVVLNHVEAMDFAGQYSRVFMFFVVSGYCIFEAISSVYARGGGCRPAWTFLKRRWWRIAPPVIAALVYLVFVRFGLGFSAAGWRKEIDPISWPLHATLTSWIPGLGITQPPWTNTAWVTGPHWTLGYEVQFYLLVALLVGLKAWHRMPLWVLATAMLSTGLLCAMLWSRPWTGTVLDGAACFGLGAMAWVCLTPSTSARAKPWAGGAVVCAAVLCVVMFWFGPTDPGARETWSRLAVSSVFAAALLAIAPWDRFWNRRWFTAPFNALGTISYSLFLVHPVNGPIARSWTERLLPAQPPEWVWTGVYLGIQIALAAAFWWVVERPLTRLKRPE